jgi:hypothetical protein
MGARVLEEHTPSIFRAQDGRNRVLQNVLTQLQNYITSIKTMILIIPVTSVLQREENYIKTVQWY